MTGTLVFDGDAGFFETIAPTTAKGITAFLLKPTKLYGTSSANDTTTITLQATISSSVDNYYKGWTIQTYGAAAGTPQSRVISSYVGSTLVATVPIWDDPTASCPYILIPPFEGLQAVEVLIDVETYPVRFRLDGVDPTADVGHVLPSGASYILKGIADLKKLRFIDTASGASSVKVTTFF